MYKPSTRGLTSIILFSVLFVFSFNIYSQVSFSPYSNFPSANLPVALAIADFNGDGKPDCISSGQNSGKLYALLNSTSFGGANASFTSEVVINTFDSVYINELLAGDFNNDGKPDIIGIMEGESQSNIFLLLNTTASGSSNVSFSQAFYVNTPNFPLGICAADFNNDGKLDVACSINPKISASSFFVFFNTTSFGANIPSFAPGVSFTMNVTSPYGLCSDDFNGDGKKDIACVNSNNSNITVYSNNTTIGSNSPSFNFAITLQLPENSECSYTAAGDFNLDGKPDIACTQYVVEGLGSEGNIAVFVNNTTIGSSNMDFSAPTLLPGELKPFVVATSDLNLDGKIDILCSNNDPTATFSVFINKTIPGSSLINFTDNFDFYCSSSSVNFIRCGDLNLDGKPDVLLTNFDNGNSFINSTTLGIDSSSFSARKDFSTGINSSLSVNAADFNLDGKTDLAFSKWGITGFSVYVNNVSPGANSPSFSTRTDISTDYNVTQSCTGDFNNDGKPDLAFVNSGQNFVSINLNTTTPGSLVTSFASDNFISSSSSAVYICSGDFNGDGKIDLAITNSTSNNISVFINNTTPGSSTVSFSSESNFMSGNGPNGIYTKDLNGDGRLDLVCSNSNDNTISVFLNQTYSGASTPVFSSKSDFQTGVQPAFVCGGDFNNDGKQDIVCSNFSSNTITLLFNTANPGSSTTSFSKTDIQSGFQPGEMSIKDFNGDGKVDIVCVSTIDNAPGNLSVYVNKTPYGSAAPIFSPKKDYAAGNNTYNVTVGDFNMDGKQDLVCSNFSDRTISIFLNSAVLQQIVNLSTFGVTVNKQNVTLNWTTSSEEDNFGFDIERNSLGNVWQKIGFVAGAGNSTTPRNYSFLEAGLTTGSHKYRLKHKHFNGSYEYHQLNQNVEIGIPTEFSLLQNYPNPFNPVTVISYQISSSGFVSLDIFDVSGRKVSSLINKFQQAGYYSVQFDSKNLSSGAYFYKLSADKFSETKKMVILK